MIVPRSAHIFKSLSLSRWNSAGEENGPPSLEVLLVTLKKESNRTEKRPKKRLFEDSTQSLFEKRQKIKNKANNKTIVWCVSENTVP